MMGDSVMFEGARLIQVIHTRLKRRGDGTKDAPVRILEQYWSVDGELLAEVDPLAATQLTQAFAQALDADEVRWGPHA
jgi:hypothetical protein